MKLIAIFVCRCPAGSDSVVFLSAAYDLSSFSFYQRNTVKEGLKFVTRTAIPRLPVGSQQEVEHEGSCAFVYRYPDSLAVLAVGDSNYPRRIAFACLNEVHIQFIRTINSSIWLNVQNKKGDTSNHPSVSFKDKLNDIIKKYKNPLEMDKLLQAQQKADAAQAVVRQTITSVLRQGESLQGLIEKSGDLSCSSKQLFKQTNKVKHSFGCCRMQ